MAMGSMAEIETQLLIAVRLGYLEEQSMTSLFDACGEVGRILRGLKKSLESNVASTIRVTP